MSLTGDQYYRHELFLYTAVSNGVRGRSYRVPTMKQPCLRGASVRRHLLLRLGHHATRRHSSSALAPNVYDLKAIKQ